MSKLDILLRQVNVMFIIGLLLGGPNLMTAKVFAGEARNINWEKLQQERRQAQYNLIKAVQRKLIENGYDPGPVDGINGPRTQKALKAYQVDHMLSPDGISGPKTLKSLGLR
jgi:hypothetical protein